MAFLVHEPPDRRERAEILLGDLVLRDREPEGILQELHQLDYADRVDHTGAQERVLVAQLPVGAHVEKVLSHVGAGPVEDLWLGRPRRLFTPRPPLRRRTVRPRSITSPPLVSLQ